MDQELLKSLQELEVLDPTELSSVYEESQDTGQDFSDLLLRRDLMSRQNLGRLTADLLGVGYVSLDTTSVEPEVLRIIPELVATKQQIVAYKRDKEGLHVAMVDPSNQKVVDFLAKKTGLNVVVHHTTKPELYDALSQYSIDINKEISEILKSRGISSTDLSKAPVKDLVDILITYAYKNKASDIHVEPLEETSLVRLRIDGLLHDIVSLPKQLHEQLVSRIKVMANLQTDEHMKPQDGKIIFETDIEELDLRVSIVPVTEGEKVVMRLLSERSRGFSLHDLGFTQRDLDKIEDAYKNPNGLILVTGPTGSGKTTTLYSILQLLNKEDVNVMTIEDPVEYDVERVNQIQVNTRTGLTFATGLRSLVRQDPDIILVGEIRDVETAQIALNSAMTGHLVLSSLHTNDAATTVPRLLDFDLEPYLVSSTVTIVIAQRLVRRICTNCRTSLMLANKDIPQELQPYLPKEELRVYHGDGCDVCYGSGYKGRVAIAEVLVMNDKLREGIMARKDADQIQKIAVKSGMTTMVEDGINKVKEGITTLEEVLRVTRVQS